jgi:hypothetical protein
MRETPAEVHMLIIVARELASYYEYLKPRQEAKGGTAVVLDRRTSAAPLLRPVERRMPTPAAAAALLSVLGFMLLHRVGADWVP